MTLMPLSDAIASAIARDSSATPLVYLGLDVYQAFLQAVERRETWAVDYHKRLLVIPSEALRRDGVMSGMGGAP